MDRLLVVLAAIASLALAPAAMAELPLVTENLSADTREVLIEEMQAISKSMGRIHTALVTGNHSTVASEAANIEASFVLKKKLSQQQRHEIHERLPQEFIAADKAFHRLAGELARHARAGDSAAERKTFEAMSAACQSCHADFAAKRFAGLVDED